MQRALIVTPLAIAVFLSVRCTIVAAQNDPRGATQNAKPAAHGCKPIPPRSAGVLGNIGELLAAGTPLNGAQFTAHPAQQICKLPGGQIYYEVGALNVDDDGSSAGSPPNWEAHPVRGGKIDTSHQNQTSYGGMLPNVPGESDPISAFNEPYIVLPGVHSRWFKEQGLHVGDGAVVIKDDQKIVAVFADVGPDKNIGEMSIKGHELFGFETFKPGLRARRDVNGQPMRDPSTQKLLTEPAIVTVNRAQTGPFVVIVFPGTSAGRQFVNVKTSLEPKINSAFTGLATAPAPSGPSK